jgi:hypothetical protein
LAAALRRLTPLIAALMLVACAPSVPPAPLLVEPQPAPPVDSIERAVAQALLDSAAVDAPRGPAGANPLEGEEPERAADTVTAADAGDAAARLPTWLRPVRQPPPVTVIGTGQTWPKRVGLQVGHWGSEQMPEEMERLRNSGGGAVGGGYTEVQVNYDLATRTAALLRARGVEVDVLSATVPMDYQADAFVAIHADGDARGVLRGYKIARSPLSHVPEWDDALVGWLYAEYGKATSMPRDDDHITPRMRFYYAFNNRRYYHAIHPSTPGAIVETGFMTSAVDRALLIGQPDRPAQGLANALLGFLGMQP